MSNMQGEAAGAAIRTQYSVLSTQSLTGVSRIGEAFARAKAEGRAAFIPYITVGHPDRETVAAVVPALVAAGADIVELGVPFSDPLADGVVIQRSTQAALANGVTLDVCLADVRASAAGGRHRADRLPRLRESDCPEGRGSVRGGVRAMRAWTA